MHPSWKKLDHIDQIPELKEESTQHPVLIFKHSIRCSISGMVWNRLQRDWKKEDNAKITPYYLDLINHRRISDAVAQEFGIRHESPQVIIIRDGKAAYDNSHMGINYQDILAQIDG